MAVRRANWEMPVHEDRHAERIRSAGNQKLAPGTAASRSLDMNYSQQQFKLEEFRQLHEHIRNFETTLGTILTASLVACTTLLTAISAWFIETYRAEPQRITTTFCYLFLSPAFLSLLTLALISSYKTAVYRNGYYIKVFFEEAGEGARWHVNLVEYRKLGNVFLRRAFGEHGDPAPLMLWALLVISAGFFFFALFTTGHLRAWHFVTPAVLGTAMILQHLAFVSDRSQIEDNWREVRRRNAVTTCPEP
jgi:hypothetical protein